MQQFLGGFVHEEEPAIRWLSLGVNDDDDYDDEDESGAGGADEGEFLLALYEAVDPQ